MITRCLIPEKVKKALQILRYYLQSVSVFRHVVCIYAETTKKRILDLLILNCMKLMKRNHVDRYLSASTNASPYCLPTCAFFVCDVLHLFFNV